MSVRVDDDGMLSRDWIWNFYIVMSDSEDSTVTYTAVSSPFGGMSDIGSPRVDGPPVMPKDPYAYVVAAFQAPPSPNYVPGPEEPEQAPLSPECVPKPLLPAPISPIADSPRYIADSDPEEDEEDPEEDPTDYPADGGDDDDDDDESSDDDEDDDDDVEDEEEEHPAPADSVPPSVHRVTARMSIRDEPPTPFWSEAEIARLLDIPSPPLSPLSPWSSPLPQIPSPPLPVSSLVPVSPSPLPASPTYPLGYRAAMIRQRSESPSTSHSLPLLPPIILSHTRASVAIMRPAAPSTYILAPRSETPPSGTPPLLPIPLPIPSPPLILPSTYCTSITPTLYRFLLLTTIASSSTDHRCGMFVWPCFHSPKEAMLPSFGLGYEGGSTLVRDRGVAGSRPQETDIVDRGPKIDEDTTDTVDSTSESTRTR
ncbi:hypothetical protein Tco_0472559 [Tanacetum coccineum]